MDFARRRRRWDFFKHSSLGFPSQFGMTFFEKYTIGTIYLFLEDIIFVVVLHEGECF